MGRFLEMIRSSADVKNLGFPELNELAKEIRSEIINTVSANGGHLASNLGVVELTLALHHIFYTPKDKIIWDVGHQSYTHKIITGRKSQFNTIRTEGGLSGFSNPKESEYDPFITGHASTSISVALGLAAGRNIKGEKYDIVAVIGDGSLTGGMALEGLNNASSVADDLIVVLNDNEMSISKNVGAFASYFSKLRLHPNFIKLRKETRTFVKSIPAIGKKILSAAETIEDHVTNFLVPNVFFESLGFSYLGPFDGHNIEQLSQVFEKAKIMEGNKLIHVVTKKGKGYTYAEDNPSKFHGTTPFNISSGKAKEANLKHAPFYTEVFGSTLTELAEKDKRITAVCSAMSSGTGLKEFEKKFPDRFFDTGIAEEHAVTFAGALASQGLKPVVALYSTFLQRGFDQIIHDICISNLPVIFAIDRAGVVGEDGATHNGVFDLSYLRMIPNMSILAPGDEHELKAMLRTAIAHNGPVAIRYPRRYSVGLPELQELPNIEIGKAEVICEGKDLAILAIGSMVFPSILACERLNSSGISAGLINMRSVKPLDEELIINTLKKTRRIFTVEENVVTGGFGSAVAELVQKNNIPIRLTIIGLPDKFIEHANQESVLERYGLTPDGIVKTILGSSNEK